ncbi:MAG: nucleotidyltransferase family protein, partial [Dysgonamonadaceae bacterium]|nr:nucleotidyltransferase family protein [Dysgonamonadaceae bacterium]
MKALIFAAGLGTRLKPLTDKQPKALVSIAGKPLLQHVIEKLKAAGFDEIIVNIHHFGSQIIDFVRQNNAFGIRVEFSDEREKLLDTGGGIKKAARFFDDGKPFLIHNVDILSNVDLRAFYQQHLRNASLATLLTNRRETSRYLLFDADDSLQGWINKRSGEVKSPHDNFAPENYRELAFSGIHALSPEIFDEMASFPDTFSIIDFYLSLCAKTPIKSFNPPGLSL